MATQRDHRSTWRAALLACLLVVISASGVLAGSLTHALAGAAGATTPPTATTSAAPSASPHALASPTATAAAATLTTASFTLAMTTAPNPVANGQRLDITVRATAVGSAAAMPGLTCSLVAPRFGGTPLLTQWPAPALTDALGQARWSIPIVDIAPGQYGIGATATSGSWSYYQQANVTITAPGG